MIDVRFLGQGQLRQVCQDVEDGCSATYGRQNLNLIQNSSGIFFTNSNLYKIQIFPLTDGAASIFDSPLRGLGKFLEGKWAQYPPSLPPKSSIYRRGKEKENMLNYLLYIICICRVFFSL